MGVNIDIHRIHGVSAPAARRRRDDRRQTVGPATAHTLPRNGLQPVSRWRPLPLRADAGRPREAGVVQRPREDAEGHLVRREPGDGGHDPAAGAASAALPAAAAGPALPATAAATATATGYRSWLPYLADLTGALNSAGHPGPATEPHRPLEPGFRGTGAAAQPVLRPAPGRPTRVPL